MVRTRKTRNLRQKAPLWICLVAAVSAVAMVALVVLFSARTVQADAGLPRPVFIASAAQPSASTTPASLAPANLARQETSNHESGDQEPRIPQNAPTPAARSWNDRIHGVASWYGGVFNGRKTASGEVYDMNAMTACHPSLPFGSIVRVVNVRNHRSVVVRHHRSRRPRRGGPHYRPFLWRSPETGHHLERPGPCRPAGPVVGQAAKAARTKPT